MRSDFVEGFPLLQPNFFEVARCKPRYFFELIGEMLDTAVVEFVSDLAQIEFIVNQKFFHPFCLLENKIFFYSYTFNIGKQFTEGTIVLV